MFKPNKPFIGEVVGVKAKHLVEARLADNTIREIHWTSKVNKEPEIGDRIYVTPTFVGDMIIKALYVVILEPYDVELEKKYGNSP